MTFKVPALGRTPVILDTGPLVAMINPREAMHEVVLETARLYQPPFVTCEAVLTEATYLLRDSPINRSAVLQMVDTGMLQIGFKVSEQAKSLLQMVKRYANVPMSFADACIVRMSEMYNESLVFTLDSDFHIYRKNTRHVIPTVPLVKLKN